MSYKLMYYAIIFICIMLISVAHGSDANLYPDLWAACSVGGIKEVKRIVNKKIDINQRDAAGSTALIHAALSGNTEVIEFLISKGAKVNVYEKSMGLSPLSGAAANGHKAAVIVLLNNGAVDINGALKLARQFYHKDISQLLLNAKK